MYGGTDAIAGGFGQDGIVLQIVGTSVPVAVVVCVDNVVAKVDPKLAIIEN